MCSPHYEERDWLPPVLQERKPYTLEDLWALRCTYQEYKDSQEKANRKKLWSNI